MLHASAKQGYLSKGAFSPSRSGLMVLLLEYRAAIVCDCFRIGLVVMGSAGG